MSEHKEFPSADKEHFISTATDRRCRYSRRGISIAPSGLVVGVYQSDSIRGTALGKCFYGRNKSADTLKRFASVRTCASVNRRSPRRIIAPRLRLVQKSSWN
jgi:hypothetical protein